MKVCSKCKTEKELCEFSERKNVKDGFRSECKKCCSEYQKQYCEANRDKVSERNKQYRKENRDKVNQRKKQYYEENRDKVNEQAKQYREANRDKLSEYHKQYREANRDKINEQAKQYREENHVKVNERSKRYYEANRDKENERKKQWRKENRDKINEYHKQYCEENRDKINERNRKRYSSDAKFKIKQILRRRLSKALKVQNVKKTQSTLDLVSCSIDFLKSYLADQFNEGMTWDNHGEWHIDHIRPCSSFDLTDEDQQRLCFHYTNLQPLWGNENISKGDKWEQ